MAKRIYFADKRCQKYALYLENFFKSKLYGDKFPTRQSVGECVYPPSLRGARGSKDDHFRNIKLYKNGKAGSLCILTKFCQFMPLTNIRIIPLSS